MDCRRTERDGFLMLAKPPACVPLLQSWPLRAGGFIWLGRLAAEGAHASSLATAPLATTNSPPTNQQVAQTAELARPRPDCNKLEAKIKLNPCP